MALVSLKRLPTSAGEDAEKVKPYYTEYTPV